MRAFSILVATLFLGACNRETMAPEPSAGIIRLETDKREYIPNDTLAVTLVNHSADTLNAWHCSTPELEMQSATGWEYLWWLCSRRPVVPQTIAPNDSFTLSLLYDARKLTPGNYRALQSLSTNPSGLGIRDSVYSNPFTLLDE